MKDYPFDMSESALINFNPDYYNKNHARSNLYNGVSSFNLKAEILNCDTCGVYKSESPMSIHGMNSSFMIVGQTPDDIQFETSHGKVLSDALKHYNYNFDDLYLSSIRKNNESEAVCHKHIASEIIVVNPMVLLVFGQEVAEELSPFNQSIGQGSTLSNGTDILITHRMSDIISDHLAYQEFYNHVGVAYSQWQFRLQQRRYVNV